MRNAIKSPPKKPSTVRVTIRLPHADMTGIKIAAEREGIPYQTLISSIIHKYLNGTLKPV